MTYFSGDPLIRYPTYPNFKNYVKTLRLFYLKYVNAFVSKSSFSQYNREALSLSQYLNREVIKYLTLLQVPLMLFVTPMLTLSATCFFQ